MLTAHDYMTTNEVSNLLGVEERQVRALATNDAITRIARGIYDRYSVERYRAEGGTNRTRVWAELTAWAAIDLLSTGTTGFKLGDTQTSRLRASLRQITDPAELATRLRDRAAVITWAGHRSVVDRIRADHTNDIVAPNRGALGLVDDGTALDVYATLETIEKLAERYKLERNTAGTITLRRVNVDLDCVRYVARLPVLAAVDGVTSLDSRVSSEGRRILASALKNFNPRP